MTNKAIRTGYCLSLSEPLSPNCLVPSDGVSRLDHKKRMSAELNAVRYGVHDTAVRPTNCTSKPATSSRSTQRPNGE
jgi:hypothetical protein